MAIAAPPRPPGPRWTSTAGRTPSTVDVARGTLLTVGALLVLVPIVWAALSSLKTPTELAQRPPTLVPVAPTVGNYTEALTAFSFGQYFLNSALVTVLATALTLAVNAMAAYALAKYNFRGRDALFLVTLATIMIPLQVIFLPVYQVVASLGLVNSLWGMIIPAAATPTGVFLLRQYMLGLPDDLIEAARIDGAGEFRILLRIILPLCRPALRSPPSRSPRPSGGVTPSCRRRSSRRTSRCTRCPWRWRGSPGSSSCRSTWCSRCRCCRSCR